MYYVRKHFKHVLGLLRFHAKTGSTLTTKKKILLFFSLCVGSNKDLDSQLLGIDESDDKSRSLCEYQTCNVSDFYISDMIITGISVEGNLVDDDMKDTNCMFDYECDEPSLLFDVAEECLILPFLEDALEASSYLDGRKCEETISNSDDSSLYVAIHQLRSCNQEPDANPYPDSDQLESFDSHMFIRNLPDLPDVPLNFPPTMLPKESRITKSVTLVLDLDGEKVGSSDFSSGVSISIYLGSTYMSTWLCVVRIRDT